MSDPVYEGINLTVRFQLAYISDTGVNANVPRIIVVPYN